MPQEMYQNKWDTKGVVNSMYVFPTELIHSMAQAAQEKGKQIGVDVTFAVADATGYLVYLERFGSAILPSIEIAQNKAYTSAVLRMSTYDFGRIAQPGQSAYGINVTVPKLVIFGGGLPLIKDGIAVGGIGVSGASAEEDEEIAAAAVGIFEQYE
jgi:uncharacterized protein GlcG (DUF336 family)